MNLKKLKHRENNIMANDTVFRPEIPKAKLPNCEDLEKSLTMLQNQFDVYVKDAKAREMFEFALNRVRSDFLHAIQEKFQQMVEDADKFKEQWIAEHSKGAM